ncbi:DAK2 domain-containing protein [Brevibacillus halotolerans]|uniref:DAK2 domain-containing protein n=1 Tax=Brevibacillus halotolerans TaxID=1507437 RepID=UPI0015EF10B4|nr:DAK2 domain-containing protein [Brevibacillus halotolerans]
MVHKRLDGVQFSQMVYLGANNLHTNYKIVDALNVFPVPDGDTGTNMNLTFTAGVEELSRKESAHIGNSAQALAKGLLMGARGNSGVILSQLFRGFSKVVAGKETIDARTFADALKMGVDTAYQAVMKPVEGTVLTVAREAAEMAVKISRTTDDILTVMDKTFEQAKLTLSQTPEYLPVLKEVGVVDSGGQGLVYIYEGFVRALHGEKAVEQKQMPGKATTLQNMSDLVEEKHSAQSQLKTEDILYGYCTEFMVYLTGSTEANKKPFAEASFRAQLDTMGDSLLVVSDEDVIKVHIHAEHPGNVLNYAQQFGSLHRIKIDNMREQHSNILREETAHVTSEEVQAESASIAIKDEQELPVPYGIIAVAAGDGIAEIFQSLGVQVVVQGGQTMNPSTEDFVKAIEELHAEKMIILPNNKNIIMAAQQAAVLASVPVAVVPTKSVPQGMAALVAFNGGEELESNKEMMTKALEQVKTGLVTHAVRDTKMGDVEIAEGDFIGINEGTIITAQADMMDSAMELLKNMVDEETGLVTIIYGEGASEEQGALLEEMLADLFEDVEVEILSGRQPLYPFIFAVE